MKKQSTQLSEAPASKLNPDILFLIARMVRDHNYSSSNDAYYTYTILKLTHVCHHWRHTFLSFPMLWTAIQVPDMDTQFLHELLIRSADYPLTVTIKPRRYTEQTVIDACDLLSRHVHRIETFKALPTDRESLNRHHESFDAAVALFDKPAPMLTTFSIESGVEIPDNFLDEIAPNLKDLTIGYSVISHRMSIFKSPTRLCLRNVRRSMTNLRLIELLASPSNQLKVLDLDFSVLPLLDDYRDSKGRRVDLPSLQSLSLHLPPDSLIFFLDHVIIPPDVAWKITCDPPSPFLNLTPLFLFFRNIHTGTHFHLDLSKDFGTAYINFITPEARHPRTRTLEVRELYGKPEVDWVRLERLLTTLRLSDVRQFQIAGFDEGLGAAKYDYYREMFKSFLARRKDSLQNDASLIEKILKDRNELGHVLNGGC